MNWNPGEMLQASGGYWISSAIHTGVKLHIFTLIDQGKCTLEDIADTLNGSERGVDMLLNALSALKLLVKENGRFQNSEFAANFLSRESKAYLGHIVMHHHHLMEAWSKLDEAVLSGEPLNNPADHFNDPTRQEAFLLGMFNLAMQLGPQLIPTIDIGERKSLLDVGGGPGTYACHFCTENPDLTATVFDRPTSLDFANKTIDMFGLSDRIDFIGGDFNQDRLPDGYDIAWLSHILHGEGAENANAVVANAVNALKPGGMILIQEFIFDNEKDGPVFPALFSLNMLIGTEEGQSYSEAEIVDMLKSAGINRWERLAYPINNGAGVIAGYLE